MLNPQSLRAVGQQVCMIFDFSSSELIVYQMAGLGINPTPPMGAFPGQQLPPQLASLAPTRQNLEQQVELFEDFVTLLFQLMLFTVRVPAAAARGNGVH
jgi:hypothetical protein